MTLPITVVDAFTDQPFSGNPAGIVVLEEAAPDAWMQAVAAEVNLAETAFLAPRADGEWDLRWFTPTVEVDLCGHATLASAQVLGGEQAFHTRSGVLRCSPAGEGAIALDLPGTRPTPTDDDLGSWAAALGLATGAVVAVLEGAGWSFVEVASVDDVTTAAMHRPALLALGGHAIVVADATADDAVGFDSVCRTFAPSAGIDEDPVTGSAHCLIGPWLAERTGRTSFLGRQASARGGTVAMEVAGDRVRLVGHAVTVWRGELLAAPPPAC
ncbi:MAG TPA: PhzF family phenazine biosynthesis protein [Aquihabitans sp.]|nr:PhzF family phenazine biosynthesis protein [Aquihabitans sp.]